MTQPKGMMDQMAADLIRAKAERIADDLMTNGNGDKAERLVLELSGKRDGGGWGRESIITRIVRILSEVRE